MPVSIPPFSNVPAADDPLTSPWAQQLTQFVVDSGRGFVRGAVKPSPQSVPAAVETPITGLSVQGPTAANRATRISYWLRVASVTTQPAVATVVTVLLRVDSTVGTVIERHTYPWAPGQANADALGFSIMGSSRSYPLTAGQFVYLNLYLGSSLALTIGDSSIIEAFDVGKWPPS